MAVRPGSTTSTTSGTRTPQRRGTSASPTVPAGEAPDVALLSMNESGDAPHSALLTHADRVAPRFSGATRAVVWLLVAVVVPAAIWMAGRIWERAQFGPASSAPTSQAAAAVRQRLEQRYRTLFDDLSAAAEAAAGRPDLVRSAGEPASAKALFNLASSAISRLRDPNDRVALTIYNNEGEPVGWAGRPSDRTAVQSLYPGFLMVGGPFGTRLVRVAAVVDDRTRVGTVAAEHVLASARGIGNRDVQDFDFTVAAAGVPVEVTYVAGDEGGEPATAPEFSSFVIRDPSGRPIARVTTSPRAFELGRQYLREIVGTVATAVGLVGLVGMALVLAFESMAVGPGRAWRVVGVIGLTWLIRIVLLWTNFPLSYRWPSFSPGLYASVWGGGILRSPADFVLSACAVLVTVVAAALVFEWVRRTYRDRRLTFDQTPGGLVWYGLIQFATAFLALVIVIGYQQFIADTIANSTIDLLYFSFHPWSTPRLALQVGFIAFHASAALLLLLVFRLGLLLGRRPIPRRSWLPVQLGLWTAAVLVAQVLILRRVHVPFWPSIVVFSVTALASYYADHLTARIRRRTVSVRLGTVFGLVLLPSLLFSFSTSHYSEDHKRHLVETQPAQQVLRYRDNQRSALQESLRQIDAIGLTAQVFAPEDAGGRKDLAFRLWIRTELATLRLTSAVEIYDETGDLVSRFALNLPSYRQQAVPAAELPWRLTDDAVPSSPMTQRVMEAARAVYVDSRRVGTIVVRVARDYDTLPFISSHNPYFELFRSTTPERLEDTVTRDIELSVYDRQRRLVYASTRPAWLLNDDLVQRIQRDAAPFWITMSRAAVRDDVFVFWDPEQIYVLGYPHKSWWTSFVDVAELVVLVGAAYVVCLLVLALATLMTRRQAIWPMRLPGEVRRSFYGKLLLAFVVASATPMVVLSLSVHAQFVGHVRGEEETEARKNVTVARQVVEDYEASGRPLVDDDDVMVWIRSLVEQDVNVFTSGRLVATSQRDLFAAGLLSPLVPVPVYQTIALDQAAQYVGNERIGSFGYMLAAAPVRVAGHDGILTVPLALRQREMDTKIDELDRGLLLVTLLFVLGAATLGYWMAERLAMPIGRLTRATRHLAKGDFQALPVSTPSDEVQRLASAFNRMAADLEAQRGQLERTTRLEASAEMARRVAHDIKNPLTPVQLSAEHLLRVATDQGQAPRSVVETCAENILRQVRTLRQIANEFSSFGSAPVPSPEPWDVAALLEEIAASYRSGLDGRVELVATAPPDLPQVFADRVLVARALTNLVENALHAIPGVGRILLRGLPAGDRRVAIDVIDTGSGIEPAVLPRIFEPYFSTRSGGTGLGMAIVKRNIEANGGAIDVTSTPGQGTSVRILLPMAADN